MFSRKVPAFSQLRVRSLSPLPTPFVDQSVDELSHWFENLGKQEPQFTDVRNVNPLEGTVWHSDKDDRPLGSVVTSDDTPIPPFPKQDPIVIGHVQHRQVIDQRQQDRRRGIRTGDNPKIGVRFPDLPTYMGIDPPPPGDDSPDDSPGGGGGGTGPGPPRLTGDAAGADEAAGAGTVAVDREVLVGKADRVAAGKGEEGEKVDRGREAPVGRAGRLRVEPEVLARPHPLMSPSLGVVVRLLVVLAQALLVQAVDRAPSKPQVFLLPY